ncbi:MAG: Nif3-like dinuclear metal center hexameric protein, partial [Candidatus Enterosoma sp.]
NPFVLDDPTYRYADVEKPISLFELLSKIQSIFSLPYIQYLKGEKEEIQRIAVVLGGGGNMSRTAFEHGADVYISGDMAHHSRLDITRYGLNYIDLPHECEEKCFIEGMSRILRQIDPDLALIPVYCQHYFSCYGGDEHA